MASQTGKSSDEIRRILANNLRKYRLYHRYSQSELAERSDLSPGHINDVEQARKWLSADSIGRIADALQIQPHMLLQPESQGVPNPRCLLSSYSTLIHNGLHRLLDSAANELLLQIDNKDPEAHNPVDSAE
ncbi:MAG: helix-turn-helix domain-containing protein [Spirochaeta sp.]